MKRVFNLFLASLLALTVLFISETNVNASTKIQLGKTYHGIGGGKTYEFTLNTSGVLSITGTWFDDSGFIYLNEKNGEFIGNYFTTYDSSTKTHKYNEKIYLVSGTYELVVSESESGLDNDTAYEFKLGFNGNYESFLNTLSNKHNSMKTANSIDYLKTYKGVICVNDDVDYYKFTLPYESYLQIDATAYKLRSLVFTIHNSKGEELDHETVYHEKDLGNGSGVLTFQLKKGTYYLHVDTYDLDEVGGFYKFKTSLKLNKLTKLTISKATNSHKLSWSKVYRASGYRVYRRKGSSGKYALIKTINSGTTLNYNDKDALTNGQKYYYRVVPFNKYGTGKSLTKGTYKLTTPTIKGLKKNGTKKIKVTYTKNTKSTGYKIEYSTNKNFSKKTTVSVSKNLTTNKTIGSLKSGKTYYVRVRSYKKVNKTTYYSAYSTTKKIKI